MQIAHSRSGYGLVSVACTAVITLRPSTRPLAYHFRQQRVEDARAKKGRGMTGDTLKKPSVGKDKGTVNIVSGGQEIIEKDDRFCPIEQNLTALV